MYKKKELSTLFRIEYKRLNSNAKSLDVIYYFGTLVSTKNKASRNYRNHEWIKVYVDGDCGPPICKRQMYSQGRKTWLGKWECTHLGHCKYHWSHKK